MNNYNKQGLYNGYIANNEVRAAEDYYATPPLEVTNILQQLSLDFTNSCILEPCCGGGHMYQGIVRYCEEKNFTPDIIATDIVEHQADYMFPHSVGNEYDFTKATYPINKNIDYIIMNPPYKLIEPFVLQSLKYAHKGILVLARLQFLEGKSRYEHILKDFPPTDIYVYIDRIKCYKNGDFKNDKGGNAQAYAWFYWDLTITRDAPQLHWLYRVK